MKKVRTSVTTSIKYTLLKFYSRCNNSIIMASESSFLVDLPECTVCVYICSLEYTSCNQRMYML